MCALALCERSPDPCAPPLIRLCLPHVAPSSLRFLPVGGVVRSRVFASPGVFTSFRVRCLPRRKRCRPPLAGCRATLGDAAPVPCRVDLIDGHDGSATPVTLRFQADALAALGFLGMTHAAPGAFALGQGLTDVRLDVDVGGRLYRAAGTAAGTGVAGNVAVTLDVVLPSLTVYQVAHGRLEAMLDGGPDVPALPLRVEF
jgi:hypothetical protein